MSESSVVGWGGVQRLIVSLSCFLQNQLVQRQVGNGLAQASVLPFDFLESLSLLDLHPALLCAPGVVGDFTHLQCPDHLGDARPLAQPYLGFPKLCYDQRKSLQG